MSPTHSHTVLPTQLHSVLRTSCPTSFSQLIGVPSGIVMLSAKWDNFTAIVPSPSPRSMWHTGSPPSAKSEIKPLLPLIGSVEGIARRKPMATKMRTIATTCVFSTIHNVHSIRADQLREEERTQFCHYCLTHFFWEKKKEGGACASAHSFCIFHVASCARAPTTGPFRSPCTGSPGGCACSSPCLHCPFFNAARAASLHAARLTANPVVLLAAVFAGANSARKDFNPVRYT